jgi:hypothetical protein
MSRTWKTLTVVAVLSAAGLARRLVRKPATVTVLEPARPFTPAHR